MAVSLDDVVALAFHRGPAHEANRLIHEVRARVIAEQGQALNYEVWLRGRGFEHLRDHEAPRLAFLLRSRGMSVFSCAPAFLSLFVDEILHFIAAPDFFRLLREAEGLSEAEFGARARVWERTLVREEAAGGSAGPLALLPPAPKARGGSGDPGSDAA